MNCYVKQSKEKKEKNIIKQKEKSNQLNETKWLKFVMKLLQKKLLIINISRIPINMVIACGVPMLYYLFTWCAKLNLIPNII